MVEVVENVEVVDKVAGLTRIIRVVVHVYVQMMKNPLLGQMVISFEICYVTVVIVTVILVHFVKNGSEMVVLVR